MLSFSVLRLLSYSEFPQGLMKLSPFPVTPTGWSYAQPIFHLSPLLLDIIAWCSFAVSSK